MSRVARGLSLVAGGAVRAALSPPAFAGEAGHASRRRASSTAYGPPSPEIWRKPTLSELFAAHPRDGGWAGFLLAQLDRDKPLLWVQDRMAILESGRTHPPGMPTQNFIHVEARDAREALWAMEEGVRCAALSAVIGELWGDPRVLDFTATRRLAVASERSGVSCWLVRLGGTANLSGARMRWRIASAPSVIDPLDRRAPGMPAWDAELFRARGSPPGRWILAHEGTPSNYDDRAQAGAFHLVAEPGDRTLEEVERLRA
jgi:protein ImuA